VGNSSVECKGVLAPTTVHTQTRKARSNLAIYPDMNLNAKSTEMWPISGSFRIRNSHLLLNLKDALHHGADGYFLRTNRRRWQGRCSFVTTKPRIRQQRKGVKLHTLHLRYPNQVPDLQIHIAHGSELLFALFERDGRAALGAPHGVRDRFLFGRFFVSQRVGLLASMQTATQKMDDTNTQIGMFSRFGRLRDPEAAVCVVCTLGRL
jgi:hypothetical protein